RFLDRKVQPSARQPESLRRLPPRLRRPRHAPGLGVGTRRFSGDQEEISVVLSREWGAGNRERGAVIKRASQSPILTLHPPLPYEKSHRNHLFLRVGVAMHDAASAAYRRAGRRIVFERCEGDCSAQLSAEAGNRTA